MKDILAAVVLANKAWGGTDKRKPRGEAPSG